jgi:hypothetical protein
VSEPAARARLAADSAGLAVRYRWDTIAEHTARELADVVAAHRRRKRT